MEQEIPEVSISDIDRIIRRDFSQDVSSIGIILESVSSETEKSRNRIVVDILKLANCRKEELRKYVELASFDSRDVISQAEYPRYSRYSFNQILSDEEEAEIIKRDWAQFQEWFHRK